MSKYSQDKPPKVGEVLDCRHLLKPRPKGSIGTGYCQLPNGDFVCYFCADSSQLRHLETLDTPITVYFDEERKIITSWSGGFLGGVTSVHLGNKRYTTSGETWRMRYITVKTPSGSRTWRGQGSDQYGAIVLRRPRWMVRRGL